MSSDSFSARRAKSLDCQVYNQNPCEPLPGRPLNKWGKGFRPTEFHTRLYYENGLQIYRPGDGLTVAQQRDFLAPEFFDSGCLQEKCASAANCPNPGKNTTESLQEKRLFNKVFASTDPFTVNGTPATCAGVKGASANSYVGWATTVPAAQNSSHDDTRKNSTEGQKDVALSPSSLLWYQLAQEKVLECSK